MRVPFWKKALSHVRPVVLKTAETEINPSLELVLSRGRFQLVSSNAIYSWDDLYVNFLKAFETVDFGKFKPENCLVLGLGLGSAPFILEKKMGVRTHFVCVEIDETVSDWALEHTFSRLESSVEVITTDAAIFCEVCEETFDLILMDIFVDDLVPEEFETVEFLELLKGLLNESGLLFFNRLHLKNAESEATEAFFEQFFKTVFPNGRFVDTDGNWVLINR